MILRPADGFKIKVSPAPQALIDAAIGKAPHLEPHWQDILQRLRFTAHTEGVSDSRFGKGYRIFAASADKERQLPRVTVVYLALGAIVEIKVVRIA